MGAPFTYPTSGRRVNPDGTIDIKCRICGKTICREPYRNFSTAICAVCQGEIEAGRRPEDLILEVQAQEQNQARDVYNDLGTGGFKVIGIKERIKEVVEKIKTAASRRKRGSLFAKKDVIK
jgi:hypothetical protein